MPTISTLSGRTEFKYTPDGKGGFFLEYTGRPHITIELIQKIQNEFKNKTVPGGFSMTDPIPGGFGEWIQDNSQFSPRHASHIAAVLREIGVIKESFGKKPIILQFDKCSQSDAALWAPKDRAIKFPDDWFDKFNQIRQSIAETRSALRNLEKWVWDNVSAKDVFPYPETPSEVSEALDALDQGLWGIESTTDDLRWYLCRNSLDKYLSGQRLTREEFYLLAAQGIIKIPSKFGLKEVYEEVFHYLYEDDEKKGYIDPSERPDPPPVLTENGGWIQEGRLKIGIVPEDVRMSFLRPDQKDFFKEKMPGVFSRFRKD